MRAHLSACPVFSIPPRWMSVLSLTPLLVVLLCVAVGASDGATDQLRISWTLPVAVADGQSAETRAFAAELRTFLGQQGKVLTPERETVACFRMEVKPPDPANPNEAKGFLLKIETAGARLTASDTSALKDAFEFLKSLAVRDRKGVKLAAGTFTTMEPQNLLK